MTVHDGGSGRNQARPLTGGERICEYRHCDVSLAGRKPTCRYCNEAHKAAEHRLRHEDRIRAEAAVRTAGSGPRRDSRDGLGARIYVTPAELADLLKRRVPASLYVKVSRAEMRLGGGA